MKTIFENVKKRYLKRRNALKKADKSGTSSAVVDKAKRELGVYAFLFWLENFIKPRKTKDNIEEEVIENEEDGEDQELDECEEQDEEVEEEPVVKKKKSNLEQIKQTISKKAKPFTPLEKKQFSIMAKIEEDLKVTFAPNLAKKLNSSFY